MEEEKTSADSLENPKPNKKHIPEVYILRDWKEYAGESMLIIFSVLLALILTEYFNSLHEKKETRELLNNIRNELIVNKQYAIEQYSYNIKVLRTIDSALISTKMQKEIVSNDEFHLTRIAPEGILFRFFSDVAWQIAKNHDVFSKVDIKTIKKLNQIYQDQDRIMKVEDEVAKVFLSREAGKVENAHATLIMIKNNYRGWAVDRAPALLGQYDEAIRLLEEEK